MVKRTVPGNILRRAVAVALAGAMTLSLIGCGAQSKEKREQKKFDEYCDELFVDEMGDNVLNIHYKLADPEKYGIKVNDYTLGNFTVDEIEDSEKSNKETLEKLNSFDLNEYIKAIHFDEMKVPSLPFILPTSKKYRGLK